MARAVRLLESPASAAFPLALAGGFLLASPSVGRALAARLALGGVVPAAVTPVPDPVLGALILARRALVA